MSDVDVDRIGKEIGPKSALERHSFFLVCVFVGFGDRDIYFRN